MNKSLLKAYTELTGQYNLQ